MGDTVSAADGDSSEDDTTAPSEGEKAVGDTADGEEEAGDDSGGEKDRGALDRLAGTGGSADGVEVTNGGKGGGGVYVMVWCGGSGRGGGGLRVTWWCEMAMAALSDAAAAVADDDPSTEAEWRNM